MWVVPLPPAERLIDWGEQHVGLGLIAREARAGKSETVLCPRTACAAALRPCEIRFLARWFAFSQKAS